MRVAQTNCVRGNVFPSNFGETAATLFCDALYALELECYQRLADADIRKIREFEVPALLNHDDALQAIEMGFVNPPFILDFGKAYLADPHFPEHVIEEWNERMAFWWGDEVKRVRLALFALRQFGIWYYDAKPGNVALENWSPRLDE